MENNLPLVSIIISSYNHGRYIPECLKSIISQSYKNLEILLLDDFSNDDSREMLKVHSQEFSGKKVFLFNDENLGLAKNLNAAMPLVSGKYVKIIAADDFLHPLSIEKCVEALQKFGDSFGMVFTDFFTVDETSREIQPHLDYSKMPEIFENNILKNHFLLIKNRVIAPSTLVNSEVWRNTGFYDAALIMEDYDRWLRISQVKKILYLPEKLCYYRRHTENLSQSGHIGMNLDDIYLKINNDKNGLIKNLINKRMAGIYIENLKLPENLVKSYSEYPYRTKVLAFLIKNNIPPALYKLFFQLRYGKQR